MNPQPELVMPAGTPDKLRFACAYGADAVYAGIPKFSLRARTNSFTAEQLADGIRYARERNVRVYITLNIFAHNNRLESALHALRELLPSRPDAVILSDPGLILLVRREFPELDLHLSTQANTMNWAAVRFWQEQGIRRVILPREVSLAEIAEMHARAPEVELEVFVHGAMCVALAGRCLLSGYLGHRDANLGICTNSCRWQYRLRKDAAAYALEEVTRPGEFFPIEEDEHGAYLLNSKDLCAVEYLPQLWEAGAHGFKIEGRTKSVYYLSQIGRAYRRAIDAMVAGQPCDPEVLSDIHATANRGFIPGFLITLPEHARQNYEAAGPAYSHRRFGGIVRAYDAEQGLAEVEVKNRLTVGDVLEFVSPRAVFAQTLSAMFDGRARPISVAHGGGENVWLPVEQAIEPFTIVRICEQPTTEGS